MNNFKNKFKEKKAITLIALVITIIILLMLAGITISTLAGEKGLINKAKQAKNETETSQDKENTTLSDYQNVISEIIDGAPQYTITFDSNGGTVDKTEQKIKYGNKFGNLPIPTLEHYTFAGWFTDLNAGEQITSDNIYSYAEDITLYAHWSGNKHTVTISKGTGISSVTGDGEYEYGQNVTITATAESLYVFTNWTGTSTSTNATYTFQMLDEDVQLTANATKIPQYDDQWCSPATSSLGPGAGAYVTLTYKYNLKSATIVSQSGYTNASVTSVSGNKVTVYIKNITANGQPSSSIYATVRGYYY